MYTKYTHTHTDTMKYIVSFTTSPTRIHKCRPMLNSILGQTRKPDLILLNIPKVFERTGETYDTTLPEFFSPQAPNPLSQISAVFSIKRIN